MTPAADPLAEPGGPPGARLRAAALLSDPRRFVLLALVVFPLHVAEEGDRFVPWFNALASPPIDMPLFRAVNAAGFAVTALVAALAALSGSRAALLAAIGWFGFLFFANALFHIIGTLAHGLYSPGTVTAVLLYLPFFLRFCWLAARAGVAPRLVIGVAALGALPMLVHGWLILFEGGRLF